MLGFTESLTNMVQSLRVKEVYLSQLFSRLLCGRVFLGMVFYVSHPDLPSNLWSSKRYCYHSAASYIHGVCDLSQCYRSYIEYLDSIHIAISYCSLGRPNEYISEDNTSN